MYFNVLFRNYGILAQFKFWQNPCSFWRKFYLTWNKDCVKCWTFRRCAKSLSMILKFFFLAKYLQGFGKSMICVIYYCDIFPFPCCDGSRECDILRGVLLESPSHLGNPSLDNHIQPTVCYTLLFTGIYWYL